MQAALRRSLRSASTSPSRFIAGRRYPLRTTRNFYASPIPALSFSIPSPPKTPSQGNPVDSAANQESEEQSGLPALAADASRPHEIAGNEQDAETVVEDGNGSGNGGGIEDRDLSSYGSGLKRLRRNTKPKDIPPFDIPSWWCTRNVRLHNFDPPLSQGGLDYAGTKVNHGEVSNEAGAEERLNPKTSSHVEAVASISVPDIARQYIEKLTDFQSVAQKHLEMSKEAEKGQQQVPKQLQDLLWDLREVMRVARRDGQLDELITIAEEKFGGLKTEFARFTNDESPQPGQASNSHKIPFSGVPLPSENEKPFRISSIFMNELLTLCAASFATLQSPKAHLKLLCPIDGAVYLVDRIVDEVATQLEADIIRFDAQDLAQILGDYISEGPEAAPDGLWTLGYDTGPFSSRSSDKASEEEEEPDDDVEDEAEEFGGGRPMPFGKFPSITTVPVIGIGRGGSLGDLLKMMSPHGAGFPAGIQSLKSQPRGNGNEVSPFVPVRNGAQEWNDMKMTALLEYMLGTNNVKDLNAMQSAKLLTIRIYSKWAHSYATEEQRAQRPQTARGREILFHNALLPSRGTSHAFDTDRRTIVYIRGYKELRDTQKGSQVVDKVIELVRKKRKDGQQIMIIGASCSVELAPRLSGDAIEALQAEAPESSFRHLVVAPKVPESDVERQRFETQLDDHAEHHLFCMNARHLHNMVLRMQSSRLDVYEREWALFAEQLFEKSSDRLKNELKQRLLSVDEVHRIVFTAIGTRSRGGDWTSGAEGLNGSEIGSAGTLLLESDSAKNDWAEEEQLHRDSFTKPRQSSKKEGGKSSPMPKKLSKREQKLMRGVVNADKIHTTFKDVHAPPDTIEALKTLTTLSLKRPDAFKYGVLATDKISGLLLYGPPGTGKTMLAKAVAKDTGATMLEVSGSDLYDMYVGEGEKNVAAVFSLAKKLAPCVVFIDEADAIFASRGSGGERKSHREMINQFLKEWDGMNETTAFIMVATNRPFDLDEAALRRLPRRILVDLPTEKDREAILGIHLKGEAVNPSVTISKLASQTPLYSGSDLKNIAVAAALAAVREENDEAAKYQGEEPYKYPEKRVLEQRHFDKAMEEISASISEDMDSLGAIKKFDEKYGDRRGRRKKTVYGFTGAEVKEETAKVRT